MRGSVFSSLRPYNQSLKYVGPLGQKYDCLVLEDGAKKRMFHRTTPQGDFLKKLPEENVEPVQSSFPYQTKVIETSAIERYARSSSSDAPATASPKIPPANQSQPLTNGQFYVYESTTPQQNQQEQKDTQTMNTSDLDTKSESKADSRIDIPGGVFSRPGQAPIAGRVPGAYPGAYPGAAAPTYGAPASSASSSVSMDTSAGRKLYIGQGITLSGEIEACDHLVVEGTVEAALKGASVLEIAEAGSYLGTVEIDEATIAGRFEGDLTVRGRLTIKSTGSINGAVAYKELAVEAGATIDGKVTPLDVKNAAGSSRKVSDKARRGNDYELPFDGKAVAAE